MTAVKNLAELRVAILGLGLMGGSLAMALHNGCKTILGCDTDPEILALARQRRIVDFADSDPAKILPGSDLVVLAAPVRAILDLIEALPHLHLEKAVVLDLGSTKVQITRAMEGLPQRFDPVGGHPMCGKETFGLKHADPAIFRGAAFALTPLERTSHFARRLAEELARTIGASPLWLDATTHDAWAAATSHLPYLLASALALATPFNAKPLVGTGFRSSVRLAASEPSTMLDVLTTNRDQVLEALTKFRTQLHDLESMLTDGADVDLAARLEQANQLRRLLAPIQGEGGEP
jgi:prephenate dehydrogenase